MPYPERRYDGQGGAVSATWRQASRPPDLEFPSGTAVRYLATGASTDALFGLFHWQLASVPSGARPHIHRSFTESFYVLDGTIRFFDGQRWFDGTAGDFIHVPAGGIHGFGNESGRPASMLIHFAPGAPREGSYEPAGARPVWPASGSRAGSVLRGPRRHPGGRPRGLTCPGQADGLTSRAGCRVRLPRPRRGAQGR